MKRKSYNFRKSWHAFTLKLPVFGNLLQKSILAKVSMVLGNLNQAGVDLIESIDIAKSVTDNVIVVESLENIKKGVFSGETTQQIARRLVGRLDFGQPGTVKQIAAAGGEVTKLANYQIQTIIRTSVNQVQNQASQAVYAANSKVAPKYEYVATLDSKTTPILSLIHI